MQLSSEERIKRVEMAPAEIQTRVAKAFLRDDIDDEDVQYLFNTDSIEVLNEEGSEIENVNAEEIEGIGTTGFTMRTTKPSGNKNYMTTGTGGWSTCIKGYPNDANATVLANCVGYASARFNEIINIARNTSGCTYKTLNCNAENFVERAIAAGLKTGSTPRRGAIMCWAKGTLGSSDGAGHVAIVERVDSNNQVYTSESGYGSTAFWNQIRSNSNGRWGIGSGYSFRCFIYLPDDVQNAIDGGAPAPAPSSDPFPGVSDEELARRVWTGEFGNGDDRKNRLGSRYASVQALVNRGVGKDSAPAPTPKPVVTNTLHIGDTVKIIGTGNGSSYGTSGTAYGIGWTRTVLKIWEGRKYPYQNGNNTGTTGFYKAEALQKK